MKMDMFKWRLEMLENEVSELDPKDASGMIDLIGRLSILINDSDHECWSVYDKATEIRQSLKDAILSQIMTEGK